MRTLNSVECVAKGCSLQAAMLSPNYAVADYKIEEYNATPVSISYQFDDQEDKTKWVVKELFGQGSSFPSTKSITFDNKLGGMNLRVGYSQKYADGITQGLPTQVASYVIKTAVAKHPKYGIILRVSNNIHQVPCLESVEFFQEW